MLYLIAYDLCAGGQDYEAISRKIASLAASDDDCCRIQQSVWIIRTSANTADTVLNKLKPVMDSNDQCLVTTLGLIPAWKMNPEIESQIQRMRERERMSGNVPFVF